MFKAHWPAAAAGIAVLVATCAVTSTSRPGSSRLAVVTPEGLRDGFDADLRNVVYRVGRRGSAAAARTPESAVRLRLPDLRQQRPGFRSRSSTATSSRRRSSATSTRIVRDKVGLVLWRDNVLVPAFGMAPSPDVESAAQVDGELPRLPHRGDRRRRLLRRRHEDVRRGLAGRGAQAADERRVALAHAGATTPTVRTRPTRTGS